VLPWRCDAEMAQQTRYTFRRNTASIMKGLVLVKRFCRYRENQENSTSDGVGNLALWWLGSDWH